MCMVATLLDRLRDFLSSGVTSLGMMAQGAGVLVHEFLLPMILLVQQSADESDPSTYARLHVCSLPHIYPHCSLQHANALQGLGGRDKHRIR